MSFALVPEQVNDTRLVLVGRSRLSEVFFFATKGDTHTRALALKTPGGMPEAGEISPGRSQRTLQPGDSEQRPGRW